MFSKKSQQLARMVCCKDITAEGDMPVAFCELLDRGTSIVVQRENPEHRTIDGLLPKNDTGLTGPEAWKRSLR